MAILVTGGAGYIGSHMVKLLDELGESVVVIDNLSTGFKKAVTAGNLYIGDLRDDNIMNQVFSENDIEGVIHFAADSLVAESVINPLKYYDNNVYATSRLLHHMIKHEVKYIVFSSTAATYGNSGINIITEDIDTVPVNPYGETKLAIEKMMNWVSEAHGINYTALRYFNACGAHKSGIIGEAHNPETHLIPLVLQAASGKRDKISIFGDDYQTADGTCVRDYIHVTDLCMAHHLALNKMRKEHKNGVYNLGNGQGFSVKQIIDIASKVTGVDIKVDITDRRNGDPDILIASSDLAKKELDWNPETCQIEEIINSAWKWHKLHKSGY